MVNIESTSSTDVNSSLFTSLPCSNNTAVDRIRWIIFLLVVISNTVTIKAVSQKNVPTGIKGRIYITGLTLSNLLIAPTIFMSGVYQLAKVNCGFEITSQSLDIRRWTGALQGILYSVAISTSFYTSLIIAADRLIAILLPFKYKVWMTKLRVKISVIVVWLYFCLTFSVIYCSQVWLSSSFQVATAKTPPGLLPTWVQQYFINVHVLVGFVGNTILCSLTLLFYHRQARIAIGKTPVTVNRSLHSRRFTRMSLATISLQVISWTPYLIINIMFNPADPTMPSWVTYQALPWANHVMFTDAWLNPLVYCWMNSDYRRAYVCVLKRWFRFCHVANRVRPEAEIPAIQMAIVGHS